MSTTLDHDPLVPDLSSNATPPSCPHCGTQLPSTTTNDHASTTVAAEAQKARIRIKDLEAQVRLLNGKAAAAVDRLADYEDEVAFLHSQRAQQVSESSGGGGGGGFNRSSSPLPEAQLHAHAAAAAPPPRPRPAHSRLSSLTSFIPGRRSSGGPTIPASPSTSTAQSPHAADFAPVAPAPGVSHPSASTPNLQSTAYPTPVDASAASSEVDEQVSRLTGLLQAEKVARLKAEASLSQGHAELEELTAQLFGQANEMVAQERRARAKLEERIQVLGNRDAEKRRRLERLEQAVRRVEKVKDVVG